LLDRFGQHEPTNIGRAQRQDCLVQSPTRYYTPHWNRERAGVAGGAGRSLLPSLVLWWSRLVRGEDSVINCSRTCGKVAWRAASVIPAFSQRVAIESHNGSKCCCTGIRISPSPILSTVRGAPDSNSSRWAVVPRSPKCVVVRYSTNCHNSLFPIIRFDLNFR
jgi:hypothetical protein